MRGDSGRLVQQARTMAHLAWICGIVATLTGPAFAQAADSATKPNDRSPPTEAGQTAREGLRRGIAGDLDARAQALERALDLDSGCELARWHRGEMQVAGRWLPIKDAARKIARKVQFSQYEALREKTLEQPNGDLALADWCAKQSLPDAERLHLYRVLQTSTHPPTKDQAIKRLKLRQYQGLLLPPETIETLQQQAATREEQLKQWTGTVQKWADGLASGRLRREEYVREQIEHELHAAAIPALEQVFSARGELLALELVSLLGRLKEHEATVSLVRQSITSDWPSVREAAAKQLRERPLHDYVPLLLQALQLPIQTRYLVNIGADGLVRHQHVFYREGAEENHLLEASFVGGPLFVPNAVQIRGVRSAGTQGDTARQQLAAVMRDNMARQVEAQLVRKLVVAQESVKSARMEQEVAMTNQHLVASNQAIFAALEESTEKRSLEPSPNSWWDWWQDYTESYQGEKPTYEHQFGMVNPYYVPYMHVTLMSCFPAGTQVRTIKGMMNIEDIQIGDRVLSQDVETGELAYKLVLRTTERPPSELLEIGLDQSTLSTTKGHPFWVNGVGWRMAKQLHSGDQLHALDGGATVSRVEPADSAVAYNLVVADFNNYFVGDSQVLVHDNTYRKPTRAITPGLLPNEGRRKR